MADHIGQGFVVSFKLFDREPMQRKDAQAEEELANLQEEIKQAEKAAERFTHPQPPP